MFPCLSATMEAVKLIDSNCSMIGMLVVNPGTSIVEHVSVENVSSLLQSISIIEYHEIIMRPQYKNSTCLSGQVLLYES